MADHHLLEKDPKKAKRVAKLVMDFLDPSNTDSYKALGRKHSFCPEAVKQLHERLMTDYQGTSRELREIKTQDILAKVEDRLDLALESLTPAKMDRASASQIGVLIGILTEKRQLLRGEATNIVSIEDSRDLPEIICWIVAEANRRGMDLNKAVIEGEYSSHVSVGTRNEKSLTRNKQKKARSPLR